MAADDWKDVGDYIHGNKGMDTYGNIDIRCLECGWHSIVNPARLVQGMNCANCGTHMTYFTRPSASACAQRASKIIQSGITRVVAPAPSGALAERWAVDLQLAKDMYAEVGIELVEVSG